MPGVPDIVRFEPPAPREVLSQWFRAADLVVVPSYNESFGLVAIEAQACGTPVVAARVGGLETAVAHGISGELVDGHDPAEWARVIGALLSDPDRMARLREGARAHSLRFGWDATVDATLAVYAAARAERLARLVVHRSPVPQPAPAGAVEVAP